MNFIGRAFVARLNRSDLAVSVKPRDHEAFATGTDHCIHRHSITAGIREGRLDGFRFGDRCEIKMILEFSSRHCNGKRTTPLIPCTEGIENDVTGIPLVARDKDMSRLTYRRPD